MFHETLQKLDTVLAANVISIQNIFDVGVLTKSHGKRVVGITEPVDNVNRGRKLIGKLYVLFSFLQIYHALQKTVPTFTSDDPSDLHAFELRLVLIIDDF